jgi:DNA-binding HxlR family transcriptional regulator
MSSSQAMMFVPPNCDGAKVGLEYPSDKYALSGNHEAQEGIAMRKRSAAADVFNPACPSRHALELVSSKWALLVVPALADGPLRNNELLRRVGGVTQKMLTQTLRDLERSGLVIRTDHATVPPHVDYRLSRLGLSLSRTLVALDRWAETHHAALQAAAEQYDRGPK